MNRLTPQDIERLDGLIVELTSNPSRETLTTLCAAIHDYNTKDYSYRYKADIHDRYEEMAVFNKYSLRKAGLLNRIN